MILQHKPIVRLALVTALILLVPLVAMQFTREVTWTLFDFVVAGSLLFGTGLAYELVVRRGGNTAYRLAVGVALATGLFLVWSNLAVGLIGSEDNPANLLYGGVLAVGIIGAIMARFRAQGMVRVLLATAAVQALVPVVALLIWKPALDWSLVGGFGVTAFFVALWVGAALLFRRAGAVSPGKSQGPA